jgi:hypothetical protein
LDSKAKRKVLTPHRLPEYFASGRHFAAWLGLTPKEHSTGGKPRLGKISKAGNERLRTLLIAGATAVIRHAQPGRKGASRWLLGLLKRKPRKLAAVALANKMARIVWAMMARGEAYRPQPGLPEPRAGGGGLTRISHTPFKSCAAACNWRVGSC